MAEFFPQRQLVDLAGRRERHGIDFVDRRRQPPAGNLPFEACQQLVRVDLLPGTRLHHQYRALAPFRIRPPDDRHEANGGVLADEFFDHRGVDPLAARLDQVLGSAVYRDVAIGIDFGQVARVEIALVVEFEGIRPVVTVQHARSLDAQTTHEGTVPVGQRPALVIHKLQVDAKRRAPRRTGVECRLARHGNGAQRRQLGHSPASLDFDVQPLLHVLDHRARAVRPANDNPLQRRQHPTDDIEMFDHPHPHRMHAHGDGDILVVQQPGQAGAVELRARQHELGSGHRGDERQAPAVGMEHRHRGKHHVAPCQRERIGLQGMQGVQVIGAVRIQHAFRHTGSARGVAQARGRVLVEISPAELLPQGVNQVVLPPHFRPRPVSGPQGTVFRAAVHHDHVLDRGTMRQDVGEHRRQARRHGKYTILGIVDDRDQLVLGVARIQGMADPSGRHGRVIELHVMPAVPRQRRDPVAEPKAKRLQRTGQTVAAAAQLRVTGALRRGIRNNRYDFLCPRPFGCMVQKLVERQ